MSGGVTVRRVIVRGRVQRVGYRAWTERAALERGLEGWVRNRRDGSVEAVFAGPAMLVEAMIAACRSGPSSAWIETLEQEEVTASEVERRRPGELFSVLGTV